MNEVSAKNIIFGLTQAQGIYFIQTLMSA